MNQKQRRELIAEAIKIKGSISTQEISQEFGISKMTVGRDLKELESEGIIELYHGGAMYKGASMLEYPMSIKSDLFVEEKKRIGKVAASKIKDGSSIFLETGTTVMYTALELVDKRKCNYYTNSLSVMTHLSKVDDLNLHSAPGNYRKLSNGFLGMDTQEYLTNFYFDYCVIGTEGVDSNGRVSLHSEEDALTKKAVMSRSKVKILVFDRSKMNKNFLCSIGSIDNFDIVLTDFSDVQEFFSNRKELYSKVITV
ncbi:MAG: DeoR/GlpR family DNA-binding transcription regulator [Enterococcus avium]